MEAAGPVLSKEKDMLDVERNKQNVVAFYDLMFNQCRTGQAGRILDGAPEGASALVAGGWGCGCSG